MKPVTIATYFYDGEEFILNEQIKHWASWPKEIKRNIECLAIHTGRDEISKDSFPEASKVDFRLICINDCKIWNQSGGRNLAFHLANNEWVAIMDADYIVPTESARALLNLPIPSPTQYYLYSRNVVASSKDLISYDIYDTPDTEAISTYADKGNIFIMSKTMFWDTGGNDEDFAGHRGFEDHVFLHHLQAKGYEPLKSNVKIGHYMKMVPNTGHRQARNVRLTAQKLATMERPTNPLRFTWKEL